MLSVLRFSKGTPMAIQYVKGDATKPRGKGAKIIVHCCNDLGAWGAGFVLSLSRRWPEPEAAYQDSITRGNLELGKVQFVSVDEEDENIVVANLVGQKGLKGPANPSPVRYSAIESGLLKVAAEAKKRKASVHMPRMGAGLAGGDWAKIAAIIEKTLEGLEVTVYDL
jgi:O-acetyl-ADP-ribose deacetylase (regulator of RNase III)